MLNSLQMAELYGLQVRLQLVFKFWVLRFQVLWASSSIFIFECFVFDSTFRNCFKTEFLIYF